MIYIPKVCECCGQQLVQVNTYPTSGTVTVFYHRDAEGELTNQCPKFAAMHEAHLNILSGA